MTYTPKQPARVVLSVRVEPHIKEWLYERFGKDTSHRTNHILAEYMTKHTKGGRNAND